MIQIDMEKPSNCEGCSFHSSEHVDCYASNLSGSAERLYKVCPLISVETPEAISAGVSYLYPWHGFKKIYADLYELTFGGRQKLHVHITESDLRRIHSVLTGEIERLERR